MKESQPDIRIGLITDGEPQMKISGDFTVVNNLLIGEGFHWQRNVEAFFKGKIERLSRPQQNIHIVNVLPVEDYIISVTGSEMNPAAPLEFLKAHAVISRSWALRKLFEKKPSQIPNDCSNTWEESDIHKGFDVCSDDHCQRYQGFTHNINMVNPELASRETYGEILVTENGTIADTRFSKCCGGHTELFSTCWADEDFDYLPAQRDPWCDLSSMNEKDRVKLLQTSLKAYDMENDVIGGWTVETDKDSIVRRLKNIHNKDIGNLLEIKIIERGKSNRAKRISLIGTKGAVNIGKELAIRRLLSGNCLYSSDFDIIETPKSFIFKGKGWGHGVGLCQIGASRMAYEGHDYKEILSFYYPGTKIVKAYE